VIVAIVAHSGIAPRPRGSGPQSWRLVRSLVVSEQPSGLYLKVVAQFPSLNRNALSCVGRRQIASTSGEHHHPASATTFSALGGFMLPQRATRCVVAVFGDVLRVHPFDGDAGVVSLAYGVLTMRAYKTPQNPLETIAPSATCASPVVG
jgi:hypothetical protein